VCGLKDLIIANKRKFLPKVHLIFQLLKAKELSTLFSVFLPTYSYNDWQHRHQLQHTRMYRSAREWLHEDQRSFTNWQHASNYKLKAAPENAAELHGIHRSLNSKLLSSRVLL
jgi:hypothetical protein